MKETAESSKGMIWTGRVISGLVSAFLVFDAFLKLTKPAAVLESCSHLGLPVSEMTTIAVILLGCVVLYVIPMTSIGGAILLTGYLGGAVSTHVRVGDPLFSHILFPVYMGILLWLGLYLRDARLRELVPTATGK